MAIIMDGNGRWANQRGEERLYGHHNGVESVRSVVKAAADVGVEYLTIYAFSTENWGRPQPEVDGLMSLLGQTILHEIEDLTRNGVKMRFIGDIAALPDSLQKSIAVAEQVSIPDHEFRLTLVIALNYSSRWEITRAVKSIAESVRSGQLQSGQITEETVSASLTTEGIPDPELLIRTSGEERLSNFLLWQLSYTELYFTPVLWPEFGSEEFLKALTEYNRRDRRFGRIQTIQKDQD